MTTHSVPSQYLGMWRRTLLEQAGVIDTSTLVLVIQTEQYHADIRIPSDRPDFKDVKYLADCASEQLRWLATQQGFTGITEINGDISQWLRDHDYQPSNGQRDIGEMTFESEDVIVEIGIEAEYREIWQKIKDSQFNLSVSHIAGVDRHGYELPARLFTAGKQFAYVRPRSTVLPKSASFLEAIDTVKPSRELLLDWLDFEISFGEIQDKGFGKILHSTLPFREQEMMSLM
ncbi:hypothetical protein [Methyloradius palustris]|uniref:Uncharacterized protein n=1 Tax=Methyloradius palustris TaxID=2778876 RepID=A0A8D5G7J8_9PROT|nr:hypothetical protein [Methyloradius palustris]BCM24607.1 hypothetical protein ZMTM_08660 [Methyloradius palustris]